MKNTEEFDLINGEFNAEEAKDLLTTLFQDKIAFHQRKNFSANERYGKDDLHSLKRIEVLQNNCSRIIELMDSMQNENCEFTIQASINVTVLKLA